MGDTEVAGQSAADDEQQSPEAVASQEPDQEPDSQDAPSTPGADDAVPPAKPPVVDPDNLYHG
jgi:hypothetical protein